MQRTITLTAVTACLAAQSAAEIKRLLDDYYSESDEIYHKKSVLKKAEKCIAALNIDVNPEDVFQHNRKLRSERSDLESEDEREEEDEEYVYPYE